MDERFGLTDVHHSVEHGWHVDVVDWQKDGFAFIVKVEQPGSLSEPWYEALKELVRLANRKED